MVKNILFVLGFMLFFLNTNYSQFYTKTQIISIDVNKEANEGDFYLDTLNKDYFIGLTSGRVGSLTDKADSIIFFNDTNLIFYWNFKENDTVNFTPLLNHIKGVVVSPKTASYTLVESDGGSVLTFNSSSPVTLTIPSGLPIGYNISVYQIGTGQVTIVGAGGVSVKNRLQLNKTAGKDAGIGIICTATNVFHITGDLTK